MKKIELYFPFTPVAKGRPRFSRYGHTYTPQKTAEYEKSIADFYKTHCREVFDGAIQVKIKFQMPIPKSYSKKLIAQIQEGTFKYTKKPDLDNLGKSVLDALNGVAFTDDSWITKLTLVKQYSSYPGVRLEIKEDLE